MVAVALLGHCLNSCEPSLTMHARWEATEGTPSKTTALLKVEKSSLLGLWCLARLEAIEVSLGRPWKAFLVAGLGSHNFAYSLRPREASLENQTERNACLVYRPWEVSLGRPGKAFLVARLGSHNFACSLGGHGKHHLKIELNVDRAC